MNRCRVFGYSVPEVPAGNRTTENPAPRSRLKREYLTMLRMVEIYCADHHVAGGGMLCPDCDGFLAYAERRLEKCPYGVDKPTCARCPIHCYKREPREMARTIMKYSGPRMVLSHPWLSFTHLLDKARRVRHPMEVRRSERG